MSALSALSALSAPSALSALSAALGVRARHVVLISGSTSRDKVVEVADEAVDEALRDRLEALLGS